MTDNSTNSDLVDPADEEVVVEHLHDSMLGVHSNVDASLPGIMATGRKLRRRRRLATGAAATLALSLVGGVGAWTIPNLMGSNWPTEVQPGSGGTVAPTAPPRGVTTTTPSPMQQAPERGETVTSPATVLDGRIAAYYLTQLAPEAKFADFAGQGDDTTAVYAELSLDLGEGKVGAEINVQPNFVAGLLDGSDQTMEEFADEFFSCDSPANSSGNVNESEGKAIDCQRAVAEDGTIVVQVTSQVKQAKVFKVDVLRADGTRVVFSTGNILDQKWATGETHEGLTMDQAVVIATSDKWDIYVEPNDEVQAAAKETIKPYEDLG